MFFTNTFPEFINAIPDDLILASIPKDIDMPVSLKVTRLGGQNSLGVPTISLEVVEAVSIPPEIFLHIVDDRGPSYDKCVGIATLSDIDDYPDSRAGSAIGAIYRKSSGLLEFTSSNKALLGSRDVESALSDLVSQYERAADVSNINDTLEFP